MDLLLMSNFQAGIYVFLMGFMVVFLGMGVLVAIVSLIGKIMEKVNKKNADKANQAESVSVLETAASETLSTDELEEEKIRAAIVAVLTNYYFNQGSNCEFKIKKIRRI